MRLFKRDYKHLAGLALLPLCLLLTNGCRTVSPTGSKVVAFDTVQGRSLSDIRLAALEVFQTNGFQVKSAFGRDLVFEKPASAWTSMSYGSWMDPTVWLRVKLRIEEMPGGVNVLECNVYRVQNHGDHILEEESLAYEKTKKPFKEMLAAVKARLEVGPAPGGGPP